MVSGEETQGYPESPKTTFLGNPGKGNFMHKKMASGNNTQGYPESPKSTFLGNLGRTTSSKTKWRHGMRPKVILRVPSQSINQRRNQKRRSSVITNEQRIFRKGSKKNLWLQQPQEVLSLLLWQPPHPTKNLSFQNRLLRTCECENLLLIILLKSEKGFRVCECKCDTFQEEEEDTHTHKSSTCASQLALKMFFC